VFTLRCTQHLLKRLGTPVAEPELRAPTTVLGNWYANTLNVGRLRLLLCVSELTLLPVIIPAKDLNRFPDRLRDALTAMLIELRIPQDQLMREITEMNSHQISRTASRRILGSMNDFAFMAEHHIRECGPDTDLQQVARELARAPCSPIEYNTPSRMTQAVFAELTTTS
jgi:hypothetical protein